MKSEKEKQANLVRWLTIEKVWVVLRWKTVEFEDVHEIVELAVDVAANRELFAVRNIHVNQRRLSLEIRQNIHQNLKANGKHKTSLWSLARHAHRQPLKLISH